MEHAISAAELLNVWERARSLPPADRALALASVADATAARDELARLTIGQRDAALLALREKVFGSQLTGQISCPACGQPMETNFSVADVQTNSLPELSEKFTENFDGHEITFRLPISDDLLTLTPGVDVASQKRRLIQRCVISATRGDEPCSVEQLSDDAINALSERMSELDPQGDVQLALSCPQCSHRWQAPLDIASFVWNEVHAWAMRLLREVHALASAYGWREADILAMSPWRRQAYLELIER